MNTDRHDFRSRCQLLKFAIPRIHPCSSVAKPLGTNGVSFTPACLRPESTLSHRNADSIKINATIKIKTPVTSASRRSLKMRREFAAVAGPIASCRACARNPIRGLGSNILCHEAVKVTATSHSSGVRVTAA